MKNQTRATVRIASFCVVLSAGLWGSNIFAVHNDFMELDGNTTADGVNDDWDDVYADCIAENGALTPGGGGACSPVSTSAKRQAFQSDSIDLDPTAYAGGTKDTQSLSDWACVEQKVLGKSDIQNAYGAVYETTTLPRQKLLYVGGDRQEYSGTTDFGIWLFREPVSCDASVNGGAKTSFTGQHTDRDLLLLADYDNGGRIATVKGYYWKDPDGVVDSGDECVGGSENDCARDEELPIMLVFYDVDEPKYNFDTGLVETCTLAEAEASGRLDPDITDSDVPVCPVASLNCEDLAALDLDAIALAGDSKIGRLEDVCAISNDDTTGNQLLDLQWRPEVVEENGFFEAGVNLTRFGQLLLQFDDCYASVLLETRSSTSIDAQLKDYVLLDTKTCGDLTIAKEANESTAFVWDFSLDPLANQLASVQMVSGNSVKITEVATHSYRITETALPAAGDWSLDSVSCIDAVDQSDVGTNFDAAACALDQAACFIDVEIEADSEVTCTFTNALAPPPGAIVVGKICDPLTPASDDFSFNITGLDNSPLAECSDSSGILINEGDAKSASYDFTLACGESFGCTGVVPGQYDVTETSAASGWRQTGLACSASDTINEPDFIRETTFDCGVAQDSVAVVNFGADESVFVNFTNTEDATIEICKDTLPDGAGAAVNFSFSYSEGADFALLPDNCLTFANLIPNETYTFTETPVADYPLSDIQCGSSIPDSQSAGASIGQGLVNITPAPGEQVTCTFVNLQTPGTIEVCKSTDPSGSNVQFEMRVEYPDWETFSEGITDGTCAMWGDLLPTVDQETYSVTETPVEGWDLTSATCSSQDNPGPFSPDAITLGAGENVSCDFVNTQRGTITVIKQTLGNDVGNFGFDANFAEGGGFGLLTEGGSATAVFTNLVPGDDYFVEETALTPGWEFTSLACDDQDAQIDDARANLVLGPGENITCTFVNTYAGSIQVVKVTQGGDGTFDFSRSWGADFEIETDAGQGSINFAELSPGEYSVSESDPGPGWELESAVCTGGQDPSAITLAPGAGVTCTFTNRKLVADIKIEKSPNAQGVDPEGTAAFEITVTNTGEIDLENVMVSDPAAPDCDADIGPLAVGESSSYNCTLSGVIAAFTNVATACGDPVDASDEVCDSDTALVSINSVEVPVNSVWALLLMLMGVAGVVYSRRRMIN